MSSSQSPRRRPNKGVFTTKSGNTIKVNRSLADRFRANKDARARRRAEYLSTLPKNRFKRIMYRLHPKRVIKYWFSREGLIMALKLVGVSIVICFLLLVGVLAYFRKDLPNITDVSGNSLPGSTSYYDRTGKTLLWQDYEDIKRIPVPSENMSQYMRDAMVAIEDKDFYHEGAFSVRGIARAAMHNVFNKGEGTQGGSTITQQLVKLNQGWTADRSITRKIKELILAVELEREYSKDDILTGYLNIASFGGSEYGVEAAARDYFHTTAKRLTLSQAAFLAAIPKYPSRYSPYSDPRWNKAVSGSRFNEEGVINRQQRVLNQMAEQGMITQEQADAAKKINILKQIHPLSAKYQGIRAPYFVLAAKQELEAKYTSQTIQRGGWKIITTLDLKMQGVAEQLVAENLPRAKSMTGGAADQAATVTEDVQTGQIMALVGGVDFSNKTYGQNNYAAGILIPPGSSFKPYDYAVFIENNDYVGAGSVLFDSKGPLPGYPCVRKEPCLKDYDLLYPGAVSLRYALGGSRNVPAVKAMLSAVPNDPDPDKINSINKVIDTASAMMANPYVEGRTYNCYRDEALTKTSQCHGAAAIGDGAFLHLDDHVNGLATLARLGKAIPRTYILKITDASGKVIDQYKQPKGTQVLRPDSAYIVNDMASDPRASYMPGSCTDTNCVRTSVLGRKFHRFDGWHFAIKTGTTNNGFDGLMTSWSTKYAVVSWVGNHMRNKDLSAAQRTPMERLTGPLTRGMMEAIHSGVKPANWTRPSGVQILPAFIQTKHIHYGDVEPGPTKELFPAWYKAPRGATTSQTLDLVSNKLATSCTPELAKQTQAGGNANTFSADIFVGPRRGSSGNSTEKDDIHHCEDEKPSISVTPSSPSCDNLTGCSFNVVVTQGTYGLSGGNYRTSPAGTLQLIVDGQPVKTKPIPTTSSDIWNYTFKYTPTKTGTGAVRVIVVDSVLYSAEESKSVEFVTTSSPSPSPTPFP